MHRAAGATGGALGVGIAAVEHIIFAPDDDLAQAALSQVTLARGARAAAVKARQVGIRSTHEPNAAAGRTAAAM